MGLRRAGLPCSSSMRRMLPIPLTLSKDAAIERVAAIGATNQSHTPVWAGHPARRAGAGQPSSQVAPASGRAGPKISATDAHTIDPWQDKPGWADDIYAAFTAQQIEPTQENVCAVVAVIEAGVRLSRQFGSAGAAVDCVEGNSPRAPTTPWCRGCWSRAR